MKNYLIIILFALWHNISAQTVNGQLWLHDYVDLQLPSGLLWATSNVGAKNPVDYGDHYAWGENTIKNDYSWFSYRWCNGSYSTQNKYCFRKKYGIVDSLMILRNNDDVVVTKWGGGWRMPTIEEQEELIENCTWLWINDFKGSGIPGRMGISKINGNTIFFPTAGFCDSTNHEENDIIGYYWSSSLNIPYSYTAMCLLVSKLYVDISNFERYYGLSVRAVINK